MESREWRIVGPAKWLLTKHDICAYLGIESRTLDRFVSKGMFPQGQLIGQQLTWTALDLACYVHLRGRFIAQNGTPPNDQPSPLDD